MRKKAAVFILLGQSNAVGHGIPMAQEDIIQMPMQNVFGLSRADNQSFDNTHLTWSGYTSHGMNLAEEQDNTYSLANCLAALWQKHIDDGNKYRLPDLYIIQIAIGGQGVTDGYMWYPGREKKLIPGKGGTVDISLFPFSKHIFALLDDSFAELGMDYEVIGLHWRGGENDTTATEEYLQQHLETIYQELFDTFNSLLHTPPITMYKLLCHERLQAFDPTGQLRKNIGYINAVFERLQQKYPNISVLDPGEAPQHVLASDGNGLFIEDGIHYSPQANRWLADCVLEAFAGSSSKHFKTV